MSIFEDTVDDSPTYSIKPVGRERFIVGSGVHALVKIFDLRMGRYNYLNAKLPETQSRTSLSRRDNSKNISIFLSNRVSSSHNRSTNLFRAPHRYRGPIYTISQPSPSSSTFYIGIEDSVIRLDMASTDDLAGKNKEWYDRNLDLGLDPHGGVDCHPLDLACYERPLPEDQGRGVRLMMQDSLWQTLEEESRGQASKSDARIPGWDQRWFQPWVSSNQKMKGPWRRPS